MRLCSAASPPALYLVTVLATAVFGAMLVSEARADAPAAAAPATPRAATAPRTRAHAPKRAKPAGRPAASNAAPRTISAKAQGLVIALDPVTGRITRPTPEQMQALTGSALGVSSATPPTAPEIVYNADGSAILTLGERYATYATLRRDANGNWVYGCTSDPATAAPATPRAPARRAEER